MSAEADGILKQGCTHSVTDLITSIAEMLPCGGRLAPGLSDIMTLKVADAMALPRQYQWLGGRRRRSLPLRIGYLLEVTAREASRLQILLGLVFEEDDPIGLSLILGLH